MKSEFEIAITQLCSDRNLAPEIILEAIENALVSAYKRNYGANQVVTVNLDPRTGQARVFVNKQVVESVQDDRSEISLADARVHKPGIAVGEGIDVELTPRDFGRIAAQTAKQVIMQRIREAERDSVYLEYADRAGEIVNGVIRNVEARTGNVTLSLGKAEAILPKSEQIPTEHYRFGQRLRVYLASVERTGHGPQITASRTHRGLLRRLLELEVPEIYNGTVEIKAIAREPGSRSKVAVAALQPGVDPVGSCVGMRGVRIQNIVNELNGEKIDVITWSPDVDTLIANALSPAKVVSVRLEEAEKTAQVVVPDRALSLAIGKEGQNARLAAKLTGWRIDIKSETEAAAEAERLAAQAFEAAQQAAELEAARQAARELLAEAQSLLDDEEEAEAIESVAIEPEGEPEAEVALEQALPEVEEQPRAEPQLAELEQPVDEVVESELALSFGDAPSETLPEPTAAEQAEVVEEPSAATEETGEQPEPVWVEEEEEIDDEEDETRKKGRGKKSRSRLLEYDERLGRVVAKKKRKPSRGGGWDVNDDWD